jgi:hypothetical protein
MADFAADTDGIKAAVPAIQNIAAALSALQANLTAALEAAGALPGASDPAWGNDAAGKAFARNYVSGAGDQYSGLQTAAQGAQAIAGAVGTMAGGFAQTDEEAQRAIES